MTKKKPTVKEMSDTDMVSTAMRMVISGIAAKKMNLIKAQKLINASNVLLRKEVILIYKNRK